MRNERTQSRFGRRLLLWLWVLVILAALATAGVLWAGWRVTNGEQNYPGTSLDGIALDGLTQEETARVLKEHGWDARNDTPLDVILPLKISFRLDRVKAGAAVTCEEAAVFLHEAGRQGNWAENLQSWIHAFLDPEAQRFERSDLSGKDMKTEYILANIRTATDSFRSRTSDSNLHLDRERNTLSLVKGGGSVSIDAERLYGAVAEALLSDETQLQWTEIAGALAMPDFASIHDEISCEMQDARFTEIFEIIPETTGITFDVETAKTLWESAGVGDTVAIPLVVTEPSVRAEDLAATLYRDRLCFMTTHFGGSTAARINNIDLAAKKLDGVIVMPGQTFSYNETVGQRTEEAGFLMAGAYADGEVIEEIGGGICQVSSTLYCAAMYAQMTTVQRSSHYFQVSYLSMGYDATVSWTWPDYRFRNDRAYPVKILTYVDDNSVTIEFWGTDVDGSRVSPYSKTVELYDEEYPNVLVGYRVTTYRNILDASGNIINTIEEPAGDYHLHDQDINWPPEKLLRDAAQATLTLAPS